MCTKQSPLVSVCVATFNQARYIVECVESVLAQKGNLNLEILIGDDGSTDGTGDALRLLQSQHPERISLIQRPENIGGTENYQDLVSRARGTFIAHLDGDDAWCPEKLLSQLTFLESHPNCVAVYTNASVADGANNYLGRFTNSHPEVFGLPYLAAKGNFLLHSSILYRASEKSRFLELSPPVIDYLMHLSLVVAGDLGFINQDLATYRRGTETSMVRNSYPQVQALLWDALKSRLSDLPPATQRTAIAHFMAHSKLARFQGKSPSMNTQITSAAVVRQHSRARLACLCAYYMLVIASREAWNSVLRRLMPRHAAPLHARF